MDLKFDTKVRKALKLRETELKGQLALVQETLAKFQPPPQLTQRRRRRRRKGVDLPELDAGLRTKG